MDVPASKPRPRRKRPSLWSTLVHFRHERLTRPGQYVLIGAMASGIAVGFPDRMVGTMAFSFFCGLILVSLAASLFIRPRVSVERSMPERCMAGELARVSIRVKNVGKKTVLDIGAYEFRLPMPLKMVDEAVYMDRLDAGQSHDFAYRVHAPRRGHYVLPGPSVMSAFPLGLTQSRRFDPQTHRLVVYPRFRTLRRLDLFTGRRYQPGGVALLSRVGESMEFIGNRDYRPGDRVRDLHPRSWARVGYPVVRQFQQEFLTRVALLVDTKVPWLWKPLLRRGGSGLEALFETKFIWGYDEELLETNLSLAASVAEALGREEYVVDLFAAGPQLYSFQSGRSLAHLDDILDILACIERSDGDPLELVGPAFSEQLRQTSTVIILLMNWDKRRADFVASLRATGVHVKVVVLTDDEVQGGEAVTNGATHLTVAHVRAGVEEL